MVSEVVYNATVAFALVVSTAACILSVTTWGLFRRSTLGRAVLLLSILMSISIIYHVVLIVSQSGPMVLTLFRSVAYTGIALFVWLVIRTQHHIRASQREVSE